MFQFPADSALIRANLVSLQRVYCLRPGFLVGQKAEPILQKGQHRGGNFGCTHLPGTIDFGVDVIKFVIPRGRSRNTIAFYLPPDESTARPSFRIRLRRIVGRRRVNGCYVKYSGDLCGKRLG